MAEKVKPTNDGSASFPLSVVQPFWCASSIYTRQSLKSHHGTFWVTHTIARKPCSEGSSALSKNKRIPHPTPWRHIPGPEETRPHNGPRVRVCVCVCSLLACVRNTRFITRLHFLSSMELFLLVGTIETISRQSPVHCFCFSLLVSSEPPPQHSGPAFLEVLGIVPLSWARQSACRVTWK